MLHVQEEPNVEEAQRGNGRRRPPLPHVDVRTRLDEAVRRGWLQIAWRTFRFLVLLLVDTLAGAAAVGLLWFGLGLGPELNPVLLLTSIVIMQPLALGVAGAYGTGERRLSFDRLAMGMALAVLLVGAQVAILNGVDYGRLTLFCLGYLLLTLPLARFGRQGVHALVNAARKRGLGQRRLLVVGDAEQTNRLVRELDERDDPHVAIVGRLSATPFYERDAVGTIAELDVAVRRTGAQGIIVDSTLTFEEFERLVHQCFELGIAVMVLPRMLDQLEAQLDLRSTEAGAMLQVRPEGLAVPQLAVKRLMDVALSLVAAVLTAPAWLLIAAAIKLDSRGPVLFKQARAGVGGRAFQMYKFRTMATDADKVKKDLQHLNESGDPRLFKIKDDPRITRVGRFLRRFSLDEIPQLVNVLKGEMSLVGPRPFFTEDLDDYEEHHFERLWVLPGITGLWQVSGRSEIVDFEEVVRLDREYIREWSIWKDLAILIRTLPAATRRDGAY